MLDLLELVELQGRVADSENVAGAGLFIDKDALPVAHDLLFDLQQALAFEHNGEDITGRDITRVVQLDELAQERLGVLLLNRLHAGHGRGIDTLPIGDEAFAVTRALAVLALPAGLANIGAPKIGFLIEQQRVIRLPVGKRLAAGGASVSARLDVPLGHIAVTAAAGGTSPAVHAAKKKTPATKNSVWS